MHSGGQKTVTVVVERIKKHPVQGKYMRVLKKYFCHDSEGVCAVGDLVRIMSIPPVSKTKTMGVIDVVEKAERITTERGTYTKYD